MAIEGSATFTMAMSSTTMNCAAQIATSANQRRGSSATPAGAVMVPAVSIGESSPVERLSCETELPVANRSGPRIIPQPGPIARKPALYAPASPLDLLTDQASDSGRPVSRSVFNPLSTIIQPAPDTLSAVFGAFSRRSWMTVSFE